MKKVIFRTLALALAALLLIPLASCGKDKPTPTPPDPKPAGREDIIGKVHTITSIFGDKETPIKARTVTTYDKQLRPQSSISERLKDGKLVPDVETFFTYDASGRLIEEKSREVGFGWDYKRYQYKDGLLFQFEDLLSGKGAQKSITQYTYGPDRKKKTGIYIFAQGREDGTHYLSYSYEGEVEVEATYTDPERKNLVARNKRTYDKEGRVIKSVATTIELEQGKEIIRSTSIYETRFGIFGEEVYSEFTHLDAQGKTTSHSISGYHYTKYNAQGLPIEGFELGDEDRNLFTLKYTFY